MEINKFIYFRLNLRENKILNLNYFNTRPVFLKVRRVIKYRIIFILLYIDSDFFSLSMASSSLFSSTVKAILT